MASEQTYIMIKPYVWQALVLLSMQPRPGADSRSTVF